MTKSGAANVNTRSILVPAIRVFATVIVLPEAYPLPAEVTVTPVTVFPLTTIVTTAPEPLPFVVVAKPVRVPSVASVGFAVMLANNSSAIVLSCVPADAVNPSQY
jgi:hypothetical protein